MDEPRVGRKLRVYQSLFDLNSAFQGVDLNLETLRADDLLQPDSVEVWRNRLGELQAEINARLTGNLHQQESGEVRRLGPMVEEWEEDQISRATAAAIAKRKKKKSLRKKSNK